MKRIFFVFFVLLLMTGCWDGYYKNLAVPYFSQEQYNYCGVACIQMWAYYDGNNPTQNYIASIIGAPTHPTDMEWGVWVFTNSDGILATEYAADPYSQDLCISYSISSIKHNCPAVLPFVQRSHYVLAKGYSWHEDGLIPIADVLYYHDPDPAYGDNLSMSAAELKYWNFFPDAGLYYVIIGYPDDIFLGELGYQDFLSRNGTFYGGPRDYDPTEFEY